MGRIPVALAKIGHLPWWVKTVGGAIGAFYTMLGIPSTGQDIAKWSPVLRWLRDHLVGDTLIWLLTGTGFAVLVLAQAYVAWRGHSGSALQREEAFRKSVRPAVKANALRELMQEQVRTAPARSETSRPRVSGSVPLRDRLISARREGGDLRSGVVSAPHYESDEWRTRVAQWTARVENTIAKQAPEHLELFSSDFEPPIDSSPWSSLTTMQAALNHRIGMLDQIIFELRDA